MATIIGEDGILARHSLRAFTIHGYPSCQPDVRNEQSSGIYCNLKGRRAQHKG